jgi:transcriptional regulator with XRE-family HTH domain
MEMPAEFTTGERIRHLRERRGMTRVVLANLVGYSADWLKRIEAGRAGSLYQPWCGWRECCAWMTCRC